MTFMTSQWISDVWKYILYYLLFSEWFHSTASCYSRKSHGHGIPVAWAWCWGQLQGQEWPYPDASGRPGGWRSGGRDPRQVRLTDRLSDKGWQTIKFGFHCYLINCHCCHYTLVFIVTINGVFDIAMGWTSRDYPDYGLVEICHRSLSCVLGTGAIEATNCNYQSLLVILILMMKFRGIEEPFCAEEKIAVEWLALIDIIHLKCIIIVFKVIIVVLIYIAQLWIIMVLLYRL